MLDRDCEAAGIAGKIASLPCQVELPDVWREHFARSGPSATTEDERRAVPRFFCRGAGSRAGMRYEPTFPGLARDDTWRGVYLCDVSRKGLRMLHSDPVFPHERLRMVLGAGSDRSDLVVEVVHCRRRQARCFEVGARFVE